MAEPRVLIPLAEGAEEMEVVIAADVLRRAGAGVELLGIGGKGPVRCSRGLVLEAEKAFEGKEEGDLCLLPGGAEGARRLAEDPRIHDLLRDFEARSRPLAAICAAPIVLAASGVGKGLSMTSHPSVRSEIEGFAGAWIDAPVVQDESLVTGQGPGAAFAFALTLVVLLFGKERARACADPMRFPSGEIPGVLWDLR